MKPERINHDKTPPRWIKNQKWPPERVKIEGLDYPDGTKVVLTHRGYPEWFSNGAESIDVTGADGTAQTYWY